MDAMGIDIQVIGMNLPTPTYWANSEIAQEVVRQCNNSIAEFVSQYPNRYIGIGSVPLQNQTLTIKEMDYLVSIGLKGITIPSHVRSKDIGIKKFKKFWQKAEELQLPVYIHPRGFTHDERLKEYFLWNSIGQPLEEALAMASIIYEGILDDFPKLQIIIAHGGGYLPYYSGRTDKAYDTRLETRQNISNKPSAYFSKFYYDTVIFDQNMLIPLIKKAGQSRVMLGSDYPRGEIEHNPVEFITTAKMLSKTIKNDILGLNAAKLFKIKF
jgi:aminocarboxymuconate-semialdehyde decarboxylase